MTDPFAHHPELKALITPPEQSGLRDLRPETLIPMLKEKGVDATWIRTEEEREALRRDFLADHEGDLWVFGYGSLMWDPAVHFTDVRRVHAPEFARRFILRDIYGGRGTLEVPGLMAALDHGSGCDGLVFRLPADLLEQETRILWAREQIGRAYTPIFTPLTLDDGEEITALCFLAEHSAEIIASDITREEQVHYLATGAGFMGTSQEYLENIAEHFKIMGVEDAEVTELVALVRAYKAGLATK